MQLTAIFLLLFGMTLHAKSHSQAISFSGKNVSLIKIFSHIKQQTGYFIVYNEAQLSKAKKVTVHASNVPLTDFLDDVFKNAPFEFTIEGRTIAIKKKKRLLRLLPHL